MKKLKLASLFAIGLFAVGVIACKQPTGSEISDGGGTETPAEPTTPETGESGTETIPEGFIKVPGMTINGTETWSPKSNVFVPDRKITIRNLLVSDHEVTQGEYETYCKYGGSSSPSDTYGKGNNFPAYCVSWYDAIVYCNLRSIAEGFAPVYKMKINEKEETDPKKWSDIQGNETEKYCGLSKKNTQWDAITMDITANGYRLPTEAEWEYLARGGKTASTEYSGSVTIGDVAWYRDNSGSKTHEVKTRNPNNLGLYDMSGNVYEWCWDWYSSITSSTLETGAASGSTRLQRGGTCYSYASGCSVSNRSNNHPDIRFSNSGFRVVRTY